MMAAGETLLSLERKLNVVDTLEQATKALAAHRHWMQRRSALSPAPDAEFSSADERPEKKKIADQPVNWALGSAPFQVDTSKNRVKKKAKRKFVFFMSSPTP